MQKNFKQFFILLVICGGSIAGINIHIPAIAQPTTPRNERPAIANESDQKLIHTLVKTSLIAVNQGNLTGNYSVLRDLGNTAFSQKNNSADLAVLFANFRQNNVDFSGIVEITPIFTQAPIINDQNVLRTTGYFPTTPNIQFDIIYELVGDRFRIDSIAVGMPTSN